jgi:hypothetical protein
MRAAEKGDVEIVEILLAPEREHARAEPARARRP